jgi:hypothetical protein
MTESKGPENSGRAAAGQGQKKQKKVKRLLSGLRPYVVGTVVTAVAFGGAAVVGAHVRDTKESKVTEPTGAVAASSSPGARPGDTRKLAVPVRPTVPVTVTIYEDLRSSDSKAFDEEYRNSLDKLLATGQVQLHYRLVTTADRAYGGTGSTVAANAAACAQDQGRYTEFVQQVWSHQPDPRTDGLASPGLMKQLAAQAGKIEADTFASCAEQGEHDGWVRQSQSAFAAQHLGDVPVVQINGTTVQTVHSTLTPKKLRTMVTKEVKSVIAARVAAVGPATTNTVVS